MVEEYQLLTPWPVALLLQLPGCSPSVLVHSAFGPIRLASDPVRSSFYYILATGKIAIKLSWLHKKLLCSHLCSKFSNVFPLQVDHRPILVNYEIKRRRRAGRVCSATASSSAYTRIDVPYQSIERTDWGHLLRGKSRGCKWDRIAFNVLGIGKTSHKAWSVIPQASTDDLVLFHSGHNVLLKVLHCHGWDVT